MEPAVTADQLALRRLVHELNTPVGVSAMAASMLPAQLDGLLAALDAPTRSKLTPLLEEWRETTALVQSSLQLCIHILGRTQAPTQTQVEDAPWIDLPAALQSAIDIHLAKRRDVQVHCQMHFPDGLQIHGDSSAWQQVVGNLVGNSLLHGFDARSHGSIQITGMLMPGNRILVHYYDDGCGLNPEAAERLFEDGFSTRLGRGGSGLGMGIARDLVHKMGGHLTVHRPAQGVHISIEAPC